MRSLPMTRRHFIRTEGLSYRLHFRQHVIQRVQARYILSEVISDIVEGVIDLVGGFLDWLFESPCVQKE